jgi:aminoglycoside adenylyltransferase-like protein
VKQLDDLSAGLGRILGDRLVGVYVHGSYALGCFNPSRSDLDVVAVATDTAARDDLAALLGSVSGAPGPLDPAHAPAKRPLEFHLLLTDDLRPWRHPCPFELHWHGALIERGEDWDLAAHITVARASGIALAGPPPQEIFPEVPQADFEDSLRRDLAWTREHGKELYRTLSPLRVWATLETKRPHSKASAAEWALPRLPADLHPVAERALVAYRGSAGFDPTPEELDSILDFVEARVA